MPTKSSRRSSSSSLSVSLARAWGSRPSSSATMKTTGNSSPLAACSVISVTAPVSSSQRSIGEARVISARKSWIAGAGMLVVEFAGGRDQLVEVRQAVLALVARFLGQVVAIARRDRGAGGSPPRPCDRAAPVSSSINRVKSSKRADRLVFQALHRCSPCRAIARSGSCRSRAALRQMVERRLAQPRAAAR